MSEAKPGPEGGTREASTETPPARALTRRPLTVSELLDLEARIKAGGTVDEEERRQLAEAQANIRAALEKIRDAGVALVETLRPALEGIPQALRQFDRWKEQLRDSVAPLLEGMRTAIREMPPKIQSALLALGKQGWYLDGSLGFSELWIMERLISAGNTGEVDEFLTEHFERRLDAIEGALAEALPGRRKILRAAFAAHRRGEFELSVPVFLIQAEGACLDLTGHHLFMRDRGTNLPEVSLHATKVASDAFSAAMLSPLTSIMPINATQKERNQSLEQRGLTTWVELNRHLVLHGESTDYDTQVNSLKALSLLNYLICFASRDAPKADVAPAGKVPGST